MRLASPLRAHEGLPLNKKGMGLTGLVESVCLARQSVEIRYDSRARTILGSRVSGALSLTLAGNTTFADTTLGVGTPYEQRRITASDDGASPPPICVRVPHLREGRKQPSLRSLLDPPPEQVKRVIHLHVGLRYVTKTIQRVPSPRRPNRELPIECNCAPGRWIGTLPVTPPVK